jgi:ribosome-associated protein
MLYFSPKIKIPVNECQFSFARSSGPGGQNVNKVNSKAILRWVVTVSHSLPEDVKARFLAKYARRISKDGDLILSSQKYRDQNRNIDDCLQKLTAMITSVAVMAAPRKATKPSRTAKLRRLQSKREHSVKKQQRRAPKIDDL